MKTSTFLLTTSFILLTSSFSRAAERAEVPEAWRIIPVCGQTFYNANLGAEAHMWQLWENYPDEPMFENIWLGVSGACPQTTHRFVNVSKEKNPDKKNIVRTNAVSGVKTPLQFTALMRGWDWRAALIDKFLKKRPNGPFNIAIWNARPSWQLDETYSTDRLDFEQWAAEHPTFMGFEGFDEYDNDICSFRNMRRWKWCEDPATKAWMDASFPNNLSNADLRSWTDTCYAKLREFHWGTRRFTGLWSNYYSIGFNILRQGLTFAYYEVESGNSGQPWRWGGLYARGATRQFHTPMGWYMATLLMHTKTRAGEGVKLDYKNTGDLYGYTLWPNVKRRNLPKHTGQARSLIRRNEFYGMMIGAVTMLIEGGSNMLTAFDPAETNKVTLSPFGEDYRDLFRWQKTHDRGVVYTPVALLTSTDELVSKPGGQMQFNHDPYAQSSFLNALVCPYADKTGYQFEYCQRPDKGEQGLMYNSEFGEFVDAISPDAGQKSEEFYSVLKCYKAAILVGWFNPKFFDRAALLRYVKEGGVVYAENRHVEMGLIPKEVKGAKGKIVLTDTFYDPRITGGKDRWSHDKTRLLYSGVVENTKIKNLLRELQDRYLPVKVEGDIQWGVNLVEGGEVKKFREIAQKGEATSRRFDEKGNGKGNEGNTNAATVRSDEDVASPLPPHHSTTPPLHRSTTPPPHHSTTSPHWLVWLINNKGVTKWLYEPEEHDLSKTANVKITDKKTGKVYTATVEPGAFTTIEIPFE